MSSNPTHNRVVLITGGTKGIGLATALAFAKNNSQCILTYNWGSVSDSEIINQFTQQSLIPPCLIQANVIDPEDTTALMNQVKERFGKIDVFISNVSFANLIKDIDEYSEKGLLKSVEYSVWPTIEYTRQMNTVLGAFPKYVIGLSSQGPDTFLTNYDYAAVTKSVLEVIIRYLNYHLYEQNIIFNVVRTRPVITDSLLSTTGPDWTAFIEKYDVPDTDVPLKEVGKVILALCSGLMDGIRGQTINADNGFDFADGLQRLYCDRKQLNLL